jgi:hypothetical protein
MGYIGLRALMRRGSGIINGMSIDNVINLVDAAIASLRKHYGPRKG